MGDGLVIEVHVPLFDMHEEAVTNLTYVVGRVNVT